MPPQPPKPKPGVTWKPVTPKSQKAVTNAYKRNNNTAGSVAATAERRAQIFELRRASVPFRTIATRLNIDVAQAYRDYQTALHELTPIENVDQMRRAELDRLDAIRMGLWSAAVKGDEKAIDRYLHTTERIAKLAGLDAPVKMELNLSPEMMLVIAAAFKIAVEAATTDNDRRIQAIDAFVHEIETHLGSGPDNKLSQPT